MSLRLLNPNAKVLNKAAPLRMNINAAKDLQCVLESNLGRKGTIKMLGGGVGDIKLTKDRNTLLTGMKPTAIMIARKADAPTLNLSPKGTIKMLVGGAGDIKLTKDRNTLLTGMMAVKAKTSDDNDTSDKKELPSWGLPPPKVIIHLAEYLKHYKAIADLNGYLTTVATLYKLIVFIRDSCVWLKDKVAGLIARTKALPSAQTNTETAKEQEGKKQEKRKTDKEHEANKKKDGIADDRNGKLIIHVHVDVKVEIN